MMFFYTGSGLPITVTCPKDTYTKYLQAIYSRRSTIHPDDKCTPEINIKDYIKLTLLKKDINQDDYY